MKFERLFYYPSNLLQVKEEIWVSYEIYCSACATRRYMIVKSCYGWYSWQRIDDDGEVIMKSFEREMSLVDVKNRLYWHDIYPN